MSAGSHLVAASPQLVMSTAVLEEAAKAANLPAPDFTRPNDPIAVAILQSATDMLSSRAKKKPADALVKLREKIFERAHQHILRAV